MGKVLQDIWIVNDSGLALFSRVYDEKINAQLFGGFMSALDSFAHEISDSGVDSFDIRNKRFSFLKRNNILFVANSEKKYKENKVHKELNKIIERFFELYEDKLKNWNGEMDIFSGFQKEITESIEDPINKFEKSFW